MKKTAVILLAFIAAFIVVEIFVVYVIGFPKFYGYKIISINEELDISKVIFAKEPYSRYWNVEGGNIVYENNNLGLPGVDVKISGSSKYVYVIGDSFIEASQIPRSLIATSILQNRIANESPNIQIVNLGIAKLDIFSAWFRFYYYENLYKPDYIVFVVEDINAQVKTMAGFPQPLDFRKSKYIGTEIFQSPFVKACENVRSKSSFINLVARGSYEAIIKQKYGESVYNDLEKKKSDYLIDTSQIGNFAISLQKYYERFNKKFILVSIIPDSGQNEYLSDFCKKNGINFYFSDKVLTPDNRFNKYGHLNAKGNFILGEFLYECLKDQIQKSAN
jgi:hypothetical protein